MHVDETFYYNNGVCVSNGSCTSAANMRVDDQSHRKKARRCTRESLARATDIQAHPKYILLIVQVHLRVKY